MGHRFSRVFSPRPDQLRKGREIGRGAYGDVLEGTLGTRPVAIKRIHQVFRDYAEQNGELLEDILVKFKNECDLLERAKSPHIVEFIGVFNEGDSVLLVMELMHQTLEKFLSKSRGTLPMEKQVDICYQVSGRPVPHYLCVQEVCVYELVAWCVYELVAWCVYELVASCVCELVAWCVYELVAWCVYVLWLGTMD